MAERHSTWPGVQSPPPGWMPSPVDGPAFHLPPPIRPTYREAHRVRAAPLLSGMAAGITWLALFGFLAADLYGYAWWSILAATVAWGVAVVLTLLGDRGVATGIAITTGIGLSVAMGFVTYRWIATIDWPLW